jgi:ribosomal protein S18 acetylase RimI-like enzyme
MAEQRGRSGVYVQMSRQAQTRIPIPMSGATEILSPVGVVSLRRERNEDRDFRYRLFCDSRAPEFALLLAPGIFEQVMAHQFQAQTVGYGAEFPQASFDIIETAERPIGRIVVDRPGTMLHLVDLAIIPELRGRGIGTAVMRALMDEARWANIPVQLEVASENDPSLQLYLRLGFVPTETVPLYTRLEWRPPAAATTG